jgi:hypothetical protein
MGVYVYRSKHMNAIKIGHYAKQNAWSRIAHRGFYSCICPSDIRDRVSVDDVELLYWFPDLKPKDEKRVHKLLNAHALCGEWFSTDALEQIPALLPFENKMDLCSKELALQTRRRL